MVGNKISVLITGANGLLGRRLVKSMKDQYDVHAVVHSVPDNAFNGVTYHTVDFSSDWSETIFPSGIDTIIHLAQSANFRNFPEMALDIFQVNINSTARLLNYAKKENIKRFIYASSGGIYGAGASAFHENSPIENRGKLGYYLGSKLCGEILAETYAHLMIVGVCRFFFMYGPEQKRTMLVPRLVDSVQNGKSISIQGDDGISINPIHVDDAVLSIQSMMSLSESRTLNIAGNEIVSIRAIAEKIGHLTGKVPIFERIDGKPQNLIANIDAMTKFLIEPKITIEEGLQDMISGHIA